MALACLRAGQAKYTTINNTIAMRHPKPIGISGTFVSACARVCVSVCV